MASPAVDADFLKKMMKVIKKKNRTRGLYSPEYRCATLERLLQKEVENPLFIKTINVALPTFVKRGRHQETQLLLDFNANPNCTVPDRPNDYSLLHEVVLKNDHLMLEILMNSGGVISRDGGQESLLYFACLNEKLECVRTVLELRPAVNMEWYDDEDLMSGSYYPVGPNYDGNMCVMLMVGRRLSLDIVELLLEKDPTMNMKATLGWYLEEILLKLLKPALETGAGLDQLAEYAARAVRIMLRFGFVPRCCDFLRDCLLKTSLRNFHQLFSLAKVLLQRQVPFQPGHRCWSRFETLREALQRSVQGLSEPRAVDLLDKVNSLLDLPVLKPPGLRLTLSLRGQKWEVGTVPLSLKASCRDLVRRSLLPRPLEPKIQALPLPDRIKEQLSGNVD